MIPSLFPPPGRRHRRRPRHGRCVARARTTVATVICDAGAL